MPAFVKGFLSECTGYFRILKHEQFLCKSNLSFSRRKISVSEQDPVEEFPCEDV